MKRWSETLGAIIAAGLAMVAVVYVATHGGSQAHRTLDDNAQILTGGDPERGKEAIRLAGCGACHDIPGIIGARGRVGPSLRSFAARDYIAGILPNTPENLQHWLQHPRELNPHTAMPDLGLDEQTARDIAAYLYADENQ